MYAYYLKYTYLYYTGGLTLPDSHFGVSVNPLFSYEMSCDAFQSSVQNCEQAKIPRRLNSCNNFREFSVRCEGKAKLQLQGLAFLFQLLVLMVRLSSTVDLLAVMVT